MSGEFLYDLRKLEFTNTPFLFPCGKTSGFVVHITVSSDGFDSNGHYFGLVNDDSGVVECSLVENGSSQFANYILSDSGFENILDNVPGVVNGIVFCKMVGATVSRNFELTTDSDGAP